ncbi:unnamed protein product [Protopolystoma xenopodis]|uniref:Uncharacterized protein n=1 Tax=Protopolystoma xenopodis TaxID=117903 RepID=A0A3S5BNI8_9PLAT|nr:unnamed protein product [Protopolystoma xenopodis]
MRSPRGRMKEVQKMKGSNVKTGPNGRPTTTCKCLAGSSAKRGQEPAEMWDTSACWRRQTCEDGKGQRLIELPIDARYILPDRSSTSPLRRGVVEA